MESSRPLSRKEKLTRDLIALMVTLNTLDGYNEKRARGEFLIEQCRQNRIAYLLRTAFDRKKKFDPFKVEKPIWQTQFYEDSATELRRLMDCIDRKNLGHGLTANFINKVFRKLDLEEIENPIPRLEKVVLEITGDGSVPTNGTLNAELHYGHTKIASLYVYARPEWKQTQQILEAAGIQINYPKHMKRK